LQFIFNKEEKQGKHSGLNYNWLEKHNFRQHKMNWKFCYFCWTWFFLFFLIKRESRKLINFTFVLFVIFDPLIKMIKRLPLIGFARKKMSWMKLASTIYLDAEEALCFCAFFSECTGRSAILEKNRFIFSVNILSSFFTLK